MATWLDKPKEGHGLAGWEVSALKAELAEWAQQLEGIVLTRDAIRDQLLVESLRRLRADVKEDEAEASVIPDGAVESGRVVADGGWTCPDVERNVYGFCIYDDDEDPCHDNCLFCHEPEERK